MFKTKKIDFTNFKRLANPLFLIMFIYLVLYTISVIFPLAWGFMSSFKEREDFASNSIFAFPDFSYWDLNKGYEQFKGYDHPFGNYSLIITDSTIEASSAYYRGFKMDILVERHVILNIGDYIVNTLLYAVASSAIKTFSPMIVAYLCSKYKSAFTEFLHAFVIFVMVTPIIGATTSALNLARQLGLYDNWAGTFIRAINFTGMYFLVFYGFFESASDTYKEAAEIDGASHFSIMVTIYFPLARVMFSTVLLLTFVQAWNDYNTSLMWLPTHLTLAYAIYHFAYYGASNKSSDPFRIAATMFLAIPILTLFIIFKKKLMGNLSLGGIKE